MTPPTQPGSREPETETDQFALGPLQPHVKATQNTMEPDPENSGKARQTAYCVICAQLTMLDARWPCEFVRGQREAREEGRREGLAELRAVVEALPAERVEGDGVIGRIEDFDLIPPMIEVVGRAAVLGLIDDRLAPQGRDTGEAGRG